jgi:transmembrane sensor
MNDYTTYTVLEFSTDEGFRSWVLKADPESTAFWENWMNNHPDQKDNILEAAGMIAAVHELYPDNLTEESRKKALDNLFIKKTGPQFKEPAFKRLSIFSSWYKIAAMWLVLLAFASLYYLAKKSDDNHSQATINSVEPDRMIVRHNKTSHKLTILLGDGSVISLEKGSTLHYPEKFSDSLRTVHLTGEAFFDIAKNPSKPFVVYSGATITKVLGTSFRIRSSKDEVLVAVKTGKVSVRSGTDLPAGNIDSEVVLSPNQQVLFNRLGEDFEKSVVKKPEQIAVDSDSGELSFDEAPLSEIFHALEKSYGIYISFDKSRFSSCRLTTQFSDETLRQRLEAISQVTGASFRITDGMVVIEGKCEQ